MYLVVAPKEYMAPFAFFFSGQMIKGQAGQSKALSVPYPNNALLECQQT